MKENVKERWEYDDRANLGGWYVNDPDLGEVMGKPAPRFGEMSLVLKRLLPLPAVSSRLETNLK